MRLCWPVALGLLVAYAVHLITPARLKGRATWPLLRTRRDGTSFADGGARPVAASRKAAFSHAWGRAIGTRTPLQGSRRSACRALRMDGPRNARTNPTRPAVPSRPLLVGPDGRAPACFAKALRRPGAGYARRGRRGTKRILCVRPSTRSGTRLLRAHAAPPPGGPLRVSHKIEFCSLRSHGARGEEPPKPPQAGDVPPWAFGPRWGPARWSVRKRLVTFSSSHASGPFADGAPGARLSRGADPRPESAGID